MAAAIPAVPEKIAPPEKKSVTALKEAEDRIGGFLVNGEGKCSETAHRVPTELEQLVAFKLLRILFPRQGTSLNELDSAINRELKKIDLAK